MDKYIRDVSESTGLKEKYVKAVIELLDEGATVPFISRYRKELTGSMTEVEVFDIQRELKRLRELEDRRKYVVSVIEAAGALTDVLSHRIASAKTMTELEDLFMPYKSKKRTRAAVAREQGLEPLAKIIMSGRTPDCRRIAATFCGRNGVKNADEALKGASDIIAEWVSESVRLRNMVRNAYRSRGVIVAKVVRGKEEALKDSPYYNYSDFSKSVRHLSSHQYLALRRAEKEGFLKIKYDLGDDEKSLADSLTRNFLPREASESCREIIAGAVRDATSRLLRPSVETEISSELKEKADKVAIDIFAENLRQLLLAPPLKGRRILAIDPGYRTGCKTVALDNQGNLLADTVIYPTPPRNDYAGASSTLRQFMGKYRLDAVAIGNGTASRETERFVKGSGLLPAESVYVVNESGASIYSASEIARMEFPDKDVTVRGAVSIGRRLLDSLAELVKIDPKSIGVGQYQHDVDQTALKEMLDFTVMSCVNSVGVDINTASGKLLSYISGIGPVLAGNILKYREQNGDFKTRQALLDVPRLGQKAFQLSAGFLRVADGSEPLDNTGIHPESYDTVRKIAHRLGVAVKDLVANDAMLDKIDAEALEASGVGGRETIIDIVKELRKPGRDPRTDSDGHSFSPMVEKFEQLRAGMELPGLVENITAFGAFVNIGCKERGLLHMSRISAKRINSVADVLKIGQEIKVRVIDIDEPRHRISLSMI